MVEVTDLLINQNRNRTYPFILDETDDVKVLIHRQVAFGPDRFGLLIRHYTGTRHLCGYVHIPRLDWQRIERQVRSAIFPRISFTGLSTKYITWMTANGKGRLVNPCLLDVEAREDHWVGFDLMSEPDCSVDEAFGYLIGFENHIWRVRNGDLAPRG